MRLPGAVLANLLTAARLLAGCCYLGWGRVPATRLQLALLLIAVATDMVDGRVARAFSVDTSLGGAFDSVADKTFVGCLVLKLTVHAVVPAWLLMALLGQYVLVAAAGWTYTRVRHRVPVPTTAIRASAIVCAASVLLAVAIGTTPASLALTCVLIAATTAHCALAWLRLLGNRTAIVTGRAVANIDTDPYTGMLDSFVRGEEG